ncbi:ACP phosphodiesterase [Rhodonellum psychrophilum GCM71 = DSM 17998]|uniref:ACP phosphodiesterase n=2 Tax=Rhodonellum TaxID=336827 RepID=U5C312_9BACT|nr:MULTISPECIES: ACP phosphodiesterase [Rhodonellum]ERM84428.1 ACP phosphodiesterase [Rhodonellum psychrophilum GCM71 = DSM 17998]MDO9550986.1 ACP phosphodiesterase [Rhodonellum sp.]SDY99874.1 Acyl carrier protein phosphodiesterase [Rhodonellum ikkaensis]
MNFLAHAYLSFGDPKVLIGNFIGDFVRGPIDTVYVKDIVIGIRLHRDIDYFTDHHPVVKEAQSILKPEYGRYSSVITDMYFDYFLGKYWNNYHHQPLEEFAQEVYATIEAHREILPENFLKAFEYMKHYNWLAGYGELDGIRRAMTGMSKRTRFDSKMETAHLFLDNHHEYLRLHFGDFFEDLVAYSKKRLEELRAEK